LKVVLKLEPPDSHFVKAAQGWLDLGVPAEAVAELKQISPKLQEHPEVLEMRFQICARTLEWRRCVEVANVLVERAPKRASGWIHRSYALHELKQTREAFEALLPALAEFPENWLVQYNLACYCCRLKEFDRALSFLEQACALGDMKEVRAMALQDSDLRELWEQIQQLGKAG
jgi:tetratricopeptide (TPR) repeat protein